MVIEVSDPASAVAAIIAAAAGAVNNTNPPDPIQLYVSDVVAAAPAIGNQLEQLTAQLPPQVQQVVEDGLAAAASEFGVPVSEVAPPAESITPPGTLGTGSESVPRGASSSAVESAGVANYAYSAITPSPAAAVPTGHGGFPVFGPWLVKAGRICDGIKPATIAAIYSAENNFRYGPDAPISPAGARGPGQFMESTWKIYGKSEQRDGPGDINSVPDSVMASGRYLCDMYGQIEVWRALGRVHGDPVDLAVAGYNAGLGAVLSSMGMPSGAPDYENQTKPYVAKVRGLEPYFEQLLVPFNGIVSSGQGLDFVGRAMEFLGIPYVWGGGGIHGPSGGGFDCSGLTSHVVYAATGGAITLPRTSETQWQVGREVPLSEARAGDLVFGNWHDGSPGHVGIYLGDGQMIHAPQPGDVVKAGPILEGMKARRILG
ncbi:NlpC/P60 family protein [Nocardia neocaledoniensis]|uniref:C40 family peptidase n=1 Tax=Nocardia neocaledoniensis TaxID=236511 RepID=UPI002456309E|nr:NlpC/P60 family protein [Nocardia neocaledoniensis]